MFVDNELELTTKMEGKRIKISKERLDSPTFHIQVIFKLSYLIIVKKSLRAPTDIFLKSLYDKLYHKLINSGVESRNTESTLLFCVYYSSTLQGH